MKNQLLHINILSYTTESGTQFNNIPLSYQLFGKKLGTAPVVLINHALTGNSNIADKNGWWKDIIGNNKVINTQKYTVLCFNIPGNGYDNFLIDDYKSFIAKDIANIFLLGLKELKIKKLFALIGGSLGGGIAWEMAVVNPNITQHLIPVATDWKATDWLIANCQIQEQFLTNSNNPVHDARMHAILCYRTPKSFKKRFQRSKNKELQIFNVESWLLHHGKKLQERYQLASYKLMNQLLKTIDVTKGHENSNILESINANIHIIGVNSDLFFTAEENKQTHKTLAATHPNVTYNEINSDHGHDAFLIEYEQLEKIIEPIFNKKDTSTLKKITFNNSQKINIAVFGKGLVGGTLINQILESTSSVLERRKIQLNIFAIANSKKVLLNKNGVSTTWENDLNDSNAASDIIAQTIAYAKENHLENLIAVDNTATLPFTENYIPLVAAGFDLVSSNKIANTVSFQFYKKLRKTLEENKKTYLYETNVGAGLPLIDTIKLLHDSGENITRIRGVFSGSLSYLFNKYSAEDVVFSTVLQEAIDKGYTEPDPREDLCGNDVARKLLILARELDLENEFEDIEIENLIPTAFRDVEANEFLASLDQLNSTFQETKNNQEDKHVLRYIGDLSGDLQQSKGDLAVKLVSVPESSPLGSLKGSDAIFEIYTESYGEQPIVIQGAGAGAEVTARGVFGDILRLTKK
ncbi:MAG: alpha/beta fold hydrolase [Tenacibaculum sp.]